MKKHILYIAIVLLSSITVTAQSYQFGLVRDFNNTGENYEFTFVMTPDFTDAAPEFSDMQLSIAISTGNTMTDFTEILTTGFTTNVNLTGSVLLNNFSIGDGTLDLWVFTLPAQSFLVTIPHTAGTAIPVFSFVVDNDPTTGTIAILENTDPINTSLAGIGFNADNLVNVDVASTGTMELYGATDPTANSYNLMDPLLNVTEVDDISGITLYPNPTVNSFVIQGIEKLDVIKIFDVNGGLVKKKDTDVINESISVKELSTGIYFVQLTVQDVIKTIKLVKE